MKENIIDNFINNLFQNRNLIGSSTKWANWMAQLTITTCKFCVEHHGSIIDISVLNHKTEVEAHFRCKCVYVPMRVKNVGTATNLGYNGADAQLYYLNRLPNYYISKAYARTLGWKDWKGNLNAVLPGTMIGGDLYKNRESKLPSAVGRAWHEADINYTDGYRNRQRILYSNDGLIFVTYDHYQTFYEITQ